MIPNTENSNRINDLIKVPCPSHLICPDGRKIQIRKWKPVVQIEDIVSVQVEGYLEEPEKAGDA